MKLFTKAMREKLLANGARRGADHKPVVRQFNPTGAGTWLLSELDIGIREIAESRELMGLGIERDLYFRPKHAIGVYAEAARAAGRIVEFGPELDAAAGRSRTGSAAGA